MSFAIAIQLNHGHKVVVACLPALGQRHSEKTSGPLFVISHDSL